MVVETNYILRKILVLGVEIESIRRYDSDDRIYVRNDFHSAIYHEGCLDFDGKWLSENGEHEDDE